MQVTYRPSELPADLARALREESEAQSLYQPTHYWQGVYAELLASLLEGECEPTRMRWVNPIYTGTVEPRRDVEELCITVRGNGGRLGHVTEHQRPRAPVGYYARVRGTSASKSFRKNLRVFSAFLAAVPVDAGLTVLEVGGGSGALAEIVLKASPSNRYVGVDLALPAWAAHRHLQEALGPSAVVPFEYGLGDSKLELDTLLADRRAALLLAAAVPRMRGHCDLFVNVKSFQEMEPDVVANYARAARRLAPRWALLLNARDGVGRDDSRGKPGTLRPVSVASTLAHFGASRRIDSPWLAWRHSDNNQELILLELHEA